MTTRHEFLKGYLVALVGDLMQRGVIRADNLDDAFKQVMAAIYEDVRADLGGVMRDLGAQVAANGLDMLAGAAKQWLGRKLAPESVKGQKAAGKAIMKMAKRMGACT